MKADLIHIPDPKRFEEITVCPHCGEPTEERFSGDEGWTFCSDECGCLEGDRLERKFLCTMCNEIKDDDACDCLSYKAPKG